MKYCKDRRVNDKIRDLVKSGWTATADRHVKLRTPYGRLVVISRTPSDHRAVKNIMSDIQRAEAATP